MTTLGTRISNDKGLNTLKDTTGLTVQQDETNAGFYPFKVDGVLALTASVTMSNAYGGVVTLSGTATALTGTMPLASAVPGAWFTFRNINASLGHQLTASSETAGTQPFTNGYTKGAKLAIAAGVGGAVIMQSDGVNFLVLGGSSGSFSTLSGSIGAGSLFTISS